MHLIKRRDVIRAAPARWLQQYARVPDDQVTMWGERITYGEIRRRLAALDVETCSPSDIDTALGGSTGWGANKCDECSADVETLVHFGMEPDYEATWQDLCGACLERGIAGLASGSIEDRSDPTETGRSE